MLKAKYQNWLGQYGGIGNFLREQITIYDYKFILNLVYLKLTLHTN